MDNGSARGFLSFSDYSVAMENVTPELEHILRTDKELAAFFRYVEKNDLREEALALLETKIDQMD